MYYLVNLIDRESHAHHPLNTTNAGAMMWCPKYYQTPHTQAADNKRNNEEDPGFPL
jgi:hypothetical protein